MGATFLMSYPDSSWQAGAGSSVSPVAPPPANPRRALREWLGLCDAILKAGGHVLVMPPPGAAPAAPLPSGSPAVPAPAALPGMIYTTNAGQLFHLGDSWVYLVSHMVLAERAGESAHVREFMRQAGIEVREAQSVWEGQADLAHLGGNRWICTWGGRSVRASLAEIHALLPPSSRVLDMQIQEPFLHGGACLNPMVNRSGDMLLLGFGAAFAESSGRLPAIRAFLGDRIEVLPIEQDDALRHACQALCVNGTVFLPEGMSTTLRGHLIRRGFTIEEMDLAELLGAGGGGPRRLVNDLRGMVVNPGAPSYGAMREMLHARLDQYPERSELPVAPPSPAA